MICASIVSCPTLVARNRKLPDRLSDPPITSSSAVLSTGILSPVTSDSSTVERPSTTTPSTGIRSPGRITTMSPGSTCSGGTETTVPSRSIRASAGRSCMSARTAADVRFFARASSIRPNNTRVIITAEVSKYTAFDTPVAVNAVGQTVSTRL